MIKCIVNCVWKESIPWNIRDLDKKSFSVWIRARKWQSVFGKCAELKDRLWEVLQGQLWDCLPHRQHNAAGRKSLSPSSHGNRQPTGGRVPWRPFEQGGYQRHCRDFHYGDWRNRRQKDEWIHRTESDWVPPGVISKKAYRPGLSRLRRRSGFFCLTL